MRKFLTLFVMVLVILSLSMAVEIDLGVSIEVKQVFEQTLACARLSILANVGFRVRHSLLPGMAFGEEVRIRRSSSDIRRIQFQASHNDSLVKAGLGCRLPVLSILWLERYRAGISLPKRVWLWAYRNRDFISKGVSLWDSLRRWIISFSAPTRRSELFSRGAFHREDRRAYDSGVVSRKRQHNVLRAIKRQL